MSLASRIPTVMVSLFVVLGLLLPPEVSAEFTGLPAGFQDEDVVDGVPFPTAFAFLPDGDLLIASKSGGLFRTDPDNGPATALDLPIAVCDQGERGLLGVAVDPDFAAGSPFFFVYYTHDIAGDESDCANRVSRFSIDDLQAEQVLIDNIPSPATNHNGGDVQFDRNELLYVSVGDGNQGGNARRLDVLNGKVLRIDRDGNIPAGNPFTGPGSLVCGATGSAQGEAQTIDAEKKSKKQKRKARKRKRKRRQNQEPVIACQEVFATGLRNPFRIALDPDDGDGAQRFYINDVGEQTWEEINAGRAGADYGWNVREGPCRTGETRNCKRNKRFVNPIHAYRHDTTGCQSITGGAFVPNNGPDWPDAYDDSYIFADFVCDKLFRLRNTRNGVRVQQLGAGETATHLAFGPDGALYYAGFFDGGVNRIVYDPQ